MNNRLKQRKHHTTKTTSVHTANLAYFGRFSQELLLSLIKAAQEKFSNF